MNGRIEDEPIPGLLHRLLTQRDTGVLTITTRSGAHEVYVRDGHPVHVVLPGSAEMIGKVLKDMGVLNDQTYKQTLEQPPAKGQRYGDMLIERGMCSADQLRLALKAQTRRKLHRLFFLADGEYIFVPGPHEQGMLGTESLKVHPWRAIYHGVRAAWNGERLAGALFLIEAQALRCTLDQAGMARYGFGADDGRIAELMRKGYWTIPDLADAAGMPAQPVNAIVYSFYITEALDVKDANTVPRLRRKPGESTLASAAPGASSTNLPLSQASAITMPTNPSSPMTPSAASSPSPSMASIPVASSQPLPPPPGPPPQVRRPTPTSTPVLQPTTGAAPSSASPDIDTVRKQIIAKAKVVENENLFEVLGISQDTNKDEVKRVYFDSAKRFHPDRLSSMGLEVLRPEVEKIFRRVSEAYGTLYDDTRREEYRQSLSQPTKQQDAEAHASAMKMLEAEMAFRRGEMALKKNDINGAIREFEAAVSGNPQEGEHLALLTYARLCANQTNRADAKMMYAQAIKLSPKCAAAHHYMGLILRDDNDLDRALNMFKKAIEIDSRMIDSEREMRLIHMRKQKTPDKKGLFDRFKKK